jgi:hypothetical protein
MDVDVSWLTPDLAMGACVPDDAMEWVAHTLKVGQVVDVRSEVTVDPTSWTSLGVRFLSLPTDDHQPIRAELLAQGVECVVSALQEGVRVLVHCQFGIGRSALLACCVLVALGHEPCEALAIAKRARPIVSPHPEQLHALLNFACSSHRLRGKHAPSATWHDLAAIAYGREPLVRAES